MRSWRAILTAATLFCAVAAPAVAQDYAHRGRGVPGPIAGAGLPVLLLAGGYYLVRRWRYR